MAGVGLADADAVFRAVERHRGGQDVLIVADGGFFAREGLVRGDMDAPRVIHERVACNARGRLVGAAEAAVDDDQPPARLDRAFAVLGLDRHMAVDNVAVFALKPEFAQDAYADLAVVVERVVRVFRLRPGGLVCDQAALKGRDVVSAERGRVAPAPQKPQEILAELAFRCAFAGVVALACDGFAPVHQRLAGQLLPAEGEFEEPALVVHRDAAVEQQVAVKALVQPALGV